MPRSEGNCDSAVASESIYYLLAFGIISECSRVFAFTRSEDQSRQRRGLGPAKKPRLK